VLRTMTGDHHRRERLNKTARSSTANVIKNSGTRGDGILNICGNRSSPSSQAGPTKLILPVCQALKGILCNRRDSTGYHSTLFNPFTIGASSGPRIVQQDGLELVYPLREMTPMDDTDYALGRTRAEYNRLIEQAELIRPLTERVLRAAGIGPGMRVLDVGCGAGDVSFLVSEIVGTSGSVIGIDLDGNAIRLADERRVARGITNVVFLEGDARSVDRERPFDAAVGRFILMYMSDPTAALRLIAQNVRPGGIVAFHETWAGMSPAAAMSLPVLASLHSLLRATFERSGARVDVAKELYSRMRDAGLEPEPRPIAEVAICFGQDAVAYRHWALFTRSMLPKIVEYGLASEEEVLRKLKRQLHPELIDACGVLPLGWLMIGQWARKPQARQSTG